MIAAHRITRFDLAFFFIPRAVAYSRFTAGERFAARIFCCSILALTVSASSTTRKTALLACSRMISQAFRWAVCESNREWKNNMTEWAESLALEITTFTLGAAAFGAPAALVVLGATTLGDLTGVRLPGELGIAGVIAAEGQFFLAGPGFFVPVLIGGALVTAALFKRRSLSTDEKAELEKVFGDDKQIFDYDRIMITNLEGVAGRPFTIFNLDGQVVMAASSAVFPNFNNLLTSNSAKRIFVHEMTHAWQYQHKPTLTRLCDIIGTRGEEILYGQNAVYQYVPGFDWSKDYNMEQQANIVGDWYSAKFNRTGGTADSDNDRYIREDILMGRV